jgi:hypothetical protein
MIIDISTKQGREFSLRNFPYQFRQYFSVTFVFDTDHSVIFIGGIDARLQRRNEVTSFDFERQDLTIKAGMLQKRTGHCGIVIGSAIYVFGSDDSQSSEKYSFS